VDPLASAHGRISHLTDSTIVWTVALYIEQVMVHLYFCNNFKNKLHFLTHSICIQTTI